MEKLRFRKPMQVRTTTRLKASLDHVLADVRGEGVEFDGEPITQEAFLNASFLWMEEMGKDVVVAAMRRHVPRLEAIMRGGLDESRSRPQGEVAGGRMVLDNEPAATNPGRKRRSG